VLYVLPSYRDSTFEIRRSAPAKNRRIATLIVHLSKLKCGFLGDSFLVRLMDSIDLYQKSDGRYNSDVITKLTYNYRSHPQILKVPNNLFYDGELVVSFGLY
jgi:hypothetical protein